MHAKKKNRLKIKSEWIFDVKKIQQCRLMNFISDAVDHENIKVQMY